MAGSRASGTICVVSILHIRPSPYVRYCSHSVFVSTKCIRDPEKIQMVFCPRSWHFNISFYVIVYLATDFSFPQSWYVCMPRWFICTERHILESIVVLDANLIGNVVMPGMDERKPFVMRLSILNIKKYICASARCYCIWVGIFTSAHVPETVSTAFPFPIFFPRAGKGSGVVGGGELYTGKWWTTRDLFLG